MPQTHRMLAPGHAAHTALAPWLLVFALAATCTGPLRAQVFGEVQSPPADLAAQADPSADTSADSTLVGYTLYANPDGTVMYLPRREIDIGRGTARLLGMQRSEPGQRARPVDGAQALRSYARYLKSFETEIPEQYKTGMDTGTRR